MKAYAIFGTICIEYSMELLFKDYHNNVPEIYLSKEKAEEVAKSFERNGYSIKIRELELFDGAELNIQTKCHHCGRNVSSDEKTCWWCCSTLKY